MVKRLVFVAILALQLFAVTSVATADPPAAPIFTPATRSQLFAVTSVATADSPWPCCLPCSGDIGN